MSKILGLQGNLKFELRLIDIKQNPADLLYRGYDLKQNPADLLSRGYDLKTLKLSRLWMERPEWLFKSEDWPETLFQ